MKRLPFDEVCRRAGGRRRYNRERGEAKEQRRAEVGRLLKLYGARVRGVQARIARELAVSRATVCRDVQSIRLDEFILNNPGKALRLMYGPPRAR